VLEAYAAGVPVIVSGVGGLLESVENGVSGLVVPPGVPQAWSEAANRLLDDLEAERLADGAWNMWSTRYTPTRGLAALEQVYAEALRVTDGG
jgi:glycosyltransferase involved in cell wall biosynthesis